MDFEKLNRVDNMAKDLEMTSIYADGTYLERNDSWHQEDSPYKAGLVKRAIETDHVEFDSCADVGCGAGQVVNLLSSTYPKAKFYGYDISPDAASFWEHHGQENLEFRQVNILDTDDRFDLIVNLDVFEHVDNYIGFLKQLRTHGDRFVFNIPMDMCAAKILSDGIRHARESVGHLHYFNRYSALETLKYCGYKIDKSFLSAAFRKLPAKSLRQKMALLPRYAASLAGDEFAANLTGGYSLCVVAHG